ncbi:hypothetical protein [Metabacillus fastidiosus]|uniref:DUF7669 domain-containing protein n=1 Tax=Metabacillus fastidiosus TaxID=1458 RepID=UPI002E2025C5|nr:hypothetical protein [Metabacillus fastidiosus]
MLIKKHTCREEILKTVSKIIKRKSKNEFTPSEVIECMTNNKTIYAESTIRTHIVAKCCINAPNNHATVYNDFERIGHGLYKLIKPNI